METILCLVGWLAASLGSTHQMPVAPFQVVTIKNVPGHCYMSLLAGGGGGAESSHWRTTFLNNKGWHPQQGPRGEWGIAPNQRLNQWYWLASCAEVSDHPP